MSQSVAKKRVIRPLRNGQITIPAEFRRQLGITDTTLLEATIQNGALQIRPVQTTRTVADSQWFKELYELFAPMREGLAHLSEDEINQAIDEAVEAARRENAARRT